MARTSPVHYIAPSAISITPNANNSSRDLAVYVAKGAKIKVYSPGITDLDIDKSTNTWQEWTFAGKNRRLNGGDGPYTIYVRLLKSGEKTGYLVFAAKVADGDKWKDKYAYVTVDGLATDTINSDDNTYWWIKLGEVLAPDDNGRTVDLDTGILGTDQYNQEWNSSSDSLPLRVELTCRIDGEDAGQTPYVPWGKGVELNAQLVRGWGTDATDAVDHWTIVRNSGNTEADAAWPGAERADSFGQSGNITLSHARGSDDDFIGVAAAAFTVTAWGLAASEESSESEYIALAAATINILPETVEGYELELSDAVVTYNPKEDSYSPSDGVTVRIRAKAQDGSVFYLDQTYIETALLHVYYLPVGEEEGEDAPLELTFTDGVATLPRSVFQAGKNINLWLENDAQIVLARATVGYVRYGEDGEAGKNGSDGEDTYSVELTKSSDSATIDPSGNVVGGYRTVSKDSLGNEFYTYRFHTSVTVMKGGEYLHLCGALDDEEELGDGNFTVEARSAGCDVKMVGTTCYITFIWHCNDGDAGTDPYTSYNRTPEEYQLMRAMTEAVAHITMNIEGKAAVTKDYRLQLVHLPTDTVIIESHNEVAAVNWSTKKNAWTNLDDIVIPLTASSGGQPVRFQTVNGGTAPDIRLIDQPGWLSGTPGFSVAWADYDEDGDGQAEYTASQHMAVEITIPIANILRTWKENDIDKEIPGTNLLKFNVTTTVDGVEYENVVPFTLNVTTDKAIYVLVPSTKQVVGTMIGGSWDSATKTISNARYSYTAANVVCNKVTCRLMSYDQNDQLTEITSASDIHDNLTFFINGAASTLEGFRTTGVENTPVGSTGHNLFDELSEIVFAIKMDGKDYESEGVPILRNGADLSIGDDGNWYIGGVNTEVFAKGTEVTDTFIYYTDPMDASTPPEYAPTESQRGNPVAPYTRTACPASVEGKFIHYVSITVFSDSEATYVYSYGTIGTGSTITVIHDRDFYATPTTKTDVELAALPEESWSESTPADYSAYNKFLYARDTARYYKNGAQVYNITVGSITYPRIVYTLLSYWGQDGSGVEFIYYLGTTNHATGETPAPGTPASSGSGTVNGTTTAYASHIDDWVPAGWTDNPQGIDHDHQIEWVSQRTSKAVSSSTVPGGHQWSGFSTPQVWSKWGENGQDGDGVEYVFMRTRNDVAPTFGENDLISGKTGSYTADEWLPYISNRGTGTGQADTEGDRCTDDPKGTTRDFPYEWVAKRTMGSPSTDAATYGKRTWKSYYDSMTGHRMSKWSTYATLRLDIDNEMDTVQTDSTGKIIAARTVETVVHLYDGASEVDISAATLSVSGGPGTAIAAYSTDASGKGKKLSWAFKKDQTMADAYAITIGYTYNDNGVPYSATFTVTASKGQTVMQLKPSQSSVVFKRQNDNTLSSPDDKLSLDIVKLDQSSTSTKAATAANLTAWGITVRYDKQSMPASKTAGAAWPDGNSLTVASTDKEICIALFDTASNTLLDRETIPIVEDGKHGENSVRLGLDNEHEDFIYDDAGVNKSGSATSQATLYDGQNVIPAGSVTWQVSLNGGSTYIASRTSEQSGSVANGWISDSGVLTVTGINVASAEVYVKAIYPKTNGSEYIAKFTANRTSQDKYDLVLKPNAIAYSPDTYTAQAIAISGTRTDMQGNKTTVGFGTGATDISNADDSGNIRLFATYVKTGGGSAVTERVKSASFTVTAGATGIAALNTGIYFELRKYADAGTSDASTTGYTIADYETIDIAKSPYYVDEYARSKSRTSYAPQDIEQSAFSSTSPLDNQPGWGSPAPAGTTTYPYIWKRTTLYYPDTQEYDAFSYVCQTGEDGPEGPDGPAGKYKLSVYQASDSMPSKPTGTSVDEEDLNDQDWYLTPSEAESQGGSSVSLTYNISGNWTRSGNQFTSPSGAAHGSAYRSRISFVTSVPNVTVNLMLLTSSEEGWDFGCIGYLDTDMSGQTASTIKSGTFPAKASGNPGVATCKLVVARAGSHFFDIVYAKDSSTSAGNDNAVVAVTGASVKSAQIWESQTWVENSLATGWSDPVKWNGVDGRDGTDGAQGHTGRWYYYAGEWSSRTYTMEETQSPYVKGSDGNFYMLDFGTGGLSTGSTTLDPVTNHNDTSGSGTEPWTLMASTMQYYIAKAFFGDYAQFGSFIINGDWLLSTKGTQNGAESQDYYSFDPSYPNTSVSGTHTAPNGDTFTGYNFVPNFAVDGKTGKTYQNDAHIKGEVHATSGVFSGLIKKTPTVVNSSNISNCTYTTEFGDDVIDFEKIGTYIVFSDLTKDYFMHFRGIFGYRSTYTAEEKDYVRSMIGNKVLVYNKSSYNIHFSGYVVKDGSLMSFDVTRNQMCFLECKVRKFQDDLYPTREGYEDIYWDCVQMNID